MEGDEREASVPPRLPGGPLVAGDRVIVRLVDDAPAIEELLPRRTRLERATGRDGVARSVVANVDLAIVVASLASPPLRPSLLDPYLVAAWAGGLEAGIALTKADLPHDEALANRTAGLYRELGYPVVRGTSSDPAMAAAVRSLVGTRTAAVVGASGVGKSTLTGSLSGVERAVGAVSRKAGTGRHTTTDPRLIPLPGGGAIIDTAGVRTFIAPRLEASELAAAFPEIAAAAADCRFRDCRHAGEAGCSVEGQVSGERLASYRRILTSASR